MFNKKVDMNRFSQILAIIIIINGFTLTLNATPIDLYLLAGQSNMSGRVNTGFTANPSVDNDILYYYRSDGPPSNNQNSGSNFLTLAPLDTGYYGPEISMARTIHSQSANKIAIVKISDGGTALSGPWNSRTNGVWWSNWKNDTTDALKDLITLGYTPALKGICWLQGESDADNLAESNDYETNFSNLVHDMFTHIGTTIDVSKAKYVTAQIGRLSSSFPYATTVRLAQSKVMDSHSNWHHFSTLDLSTHDSVHFDVESVATIGSRFAKALLSSSSMALSKVPTGQN